MTYTIVVSDDGGHVLESMQLGAMLQQMTLLSIVESITATASSGHMSIAKFETPIIANEQRTA